jgi:hypothetical protein
MIEMILKRQPSQYFTRCTRLSKRVRAWCLLGLALSGTEESSALLTLGLGALVGSQLL